MNKINLTGSAFIFVFTLLIVLAVPHGYKKDHRNFIKLPAVQKTVSHYAEENSVYIRQKDVSKSNQFDENIVSQLKLRPLFSVPLVQTYQYDAAINNTDDVKAGKLLAVAHSRNLRSKNNLRLSLFHDLTSKNFLGGVEKSDVILNTSDSNTELYQSALGIMKLLSLEPDAEGAVLKLLEQQPVWAYGFFETFFSGPTLENEQLLGRLLQASKKDPKLSRFQQNYMLWLVNQNKFDQAHSHWRSFLSKPHDTDTLFNQSFQTVDVPPPFNWVQRNLGPVLFEPLSAEGGVFISTVNSEYLVALQQITRFQPLTNYTFSTQGSDNLRMSRDSSYWTLQCLDGGREAIFKTGENVETSGAINILFETPEACSNQLLQFVIKAKSGISRSSVNLERVSVKRVK